MKTRSSNTMWKATAIAALCSLFSGTIAPAMAAHGSRRAPRSNPVATTPAVGAEDAPTANEATIEALAGLEGDAIDEIRKSITLPVRPLPPDPILVAEAAQDVFGVLGGSRGTADLGPIADGGLTSPQTIFGYDDRVPFYNMSEYPWRTVGRLDTGSGSCTGTLIGPRHVLTASHCVNWVGHNQVGWEKFTPATVSGSAPFGEAWAMYVYAATEITGSGGISDEQITVDYAVIVLDRRIGDVTGWMGMVSEYNPAWNHQAVFTTVGYPGDIGGSAVPIYEVGCSIEGANVFRTFLGTRMQLMSYCDIMPGQSGSPVFAYFNGENFPRVVAVVSAANSQMNFFAAGGVMGLLGYAASVLHQ